MRLEVQLDNSETRSYRLLPGNARYGFVITPFRCYHDQLLTADGNTNCARIVSARVRVANERAVAPSIRFVTHTIRGVWASNPERSPNEPLQGQGLANSGTISSPQPPPPGRETEKLRSNDAPNARASNIATNAIATAVDP
jgi:hypothetical protein